MIICWYTLGTQKVHRRPTFATADQRVNPLARTHFGDSPA